MGDFSHSFATTFKQDTGPQQPPPSLVFVDANHAYEAVTRDLEAWWPLLPTGGLLAGSTFINDPSRNIGVRQAVEDFMRPRGVQIMETTASTLRFDIFFCKTQNTQAKSCGATQWS